MGIINPVFLHTHDWRTLSALFAGALVLSLALAPLAIRAAFRLGAVDMGGGRRVHTGSIPRLGGLGIFLSCLAVSAVYFMSSGSAAQSPDRSRITGLALAASIVFAVGAYDDIRGLRVYKKLLFEILAACILYRFGYRAGFLSNPFGGALNLSPLDLPLTALWVIVVTNSINLIDGLDGVAAGTGAFVALTMLFVSNDPFTGAAAAILTGSLAGFLFYNYPPARLFMGDSGSLFTGFVLAAASLSAGNKSTTAFGIMVPMTAFAFPLMDMSYAVLRRYWRGLPLGNADKEHIHHKLLEKGFSKKKVILLLCGVNFLLMLLALLIVRTHHFSPLWYFAAATAAAAGGLRYLNYVELTPFIGMVINEHVSARKRMYHLYLLRAFKKDIEKMKPGEADGIYARVALLLASMDFTSARIVTSVESSMKEEFVWHNPDKKSPGRVRLSFPIERKGRVYGDVHLKRDIPGDVPILSVNELMSALSSAIYPAIEDKYRRPKKLPAAPERRKPVPLSINFH